MSFIQLKEEKKTYIAITQMIRTEKGMRNKNEGIYNYINYVLLIQKKKTETNGK